MMKQRILLLFIFAGLLWARKPDIWIHTDMTAALRYTKDDNSAKAVTDQGSDPDDQVALAIYLMQANKFNTRAIVMGVTNRNTSQNVRAFFDSVFRTAYAEDIACLNQEIGGYPHPDSLKAYESSCTAGNNRIQFDTSPPNKYDSYSVLPGTVKRLVDELKSDRYSYENPLYVIVWGGMTEAAMAVKHLTRNSETEALQRLYIVSHWHTSYTNTQSSNNCYSGELAEIYGVANCNVDCDACKYVRDEAKKADAQFRWTDCASVGQTGIVNGYNNYFNGVDGSVYKNFEKSRLGALFMKSKFVYGKPDGSDCATFYTILGEYGVGLDDYNDNGQTTREQEAAAKNTYRSRAHDMLDELMRISNIAASGPCNESRVGRTDASMEPSGFTLYQNYPNPFNSTTVIKYGLSTFSSVKIEVRDIKGGNVYTLFQGAVNPGVHRIVWRGTDRNGNQAPSGLYMTRLTVDNGTIRKSRIKKMLLLE